MADYDLPTRAQFRAKFPEFAGVDDATTDAVILEAARRVDTTWTVGDFPLAVLYLAAHILYVSADAVTGGAINSESFGPISVSYKTSANLDGLAATSYGARFLELLQLNQSGPIIV